MNIAVTLTINLTEPAPQTHDKNNHCVETRNNDANRNINHNKKIQSGDTVLTGEEPPLHSGELKHALSQVGGPTQSQLSRPVSLGHHTSMGHQLRRNHI